MQICIEELSPNVFNSKQQPWFKIIDPVLEIRLALHRLLWVTLPSGPQEHSRILHFKLDVANSDRIMIRTKTTKSPTLPLGMTCRSS